MLLVDRQKSQKQIDENNRSDRISNQKKDTEYTSGKARSDESFEEPFYRKTPFIAIIVILILISSFVVYELYTDYTAATNLEFDVKGSGPPNPGLGSIEIPIIMSFRNPSNFDTPPINAEYDIYIEGEYIGDGEVPLGIVSAGETKIDEQTLTVYYEEISDTLEETLIEDDFTVTIEGEVQADIIYRSIPVTRDIEASYTFHREPDVIDGL